MPDVFYQCVALEVRNRARLGGRNIGSIADYEDVGRGLGLQCVLVGQHDVQLVAETRGHDLRHGSGDICVQGLG